MLTAEILEVDDRRWADLVTSHPDALPFHHPAWVGLIRDCYRFSPFAAAVSAADGSLSAGTPVVEVRDPLRTRRWVSLPFTDHCAVLYGSEAARDAVLGLLRERAAAERVASVELRTAVGSSRVQGRIRRARRDGVMVRAADSEHDVSGTYYDLHVRTRRRLGVPAQSRRFFRLLWERFIDTGLGFVLLAHVGTSAVAGAVFLDGNGHLIYKFAASDEAHRRSQPNHAILWEAIRLGCERGCSAMDFGRSGPTDHGLRGFKSGWGAAERPLIYTRIVGPPRVAAGGAAEDALRGLLRRPLWVCRGVGAALYRYAA